MPGAAVVLGAGGTAQSALAALREAGIDDVTVLVRDLGRTAELRDTAERLGVAPRIVAALADPASASAELVGADVVISTLPPGGADRSSRPARARWCSTSSTRRGPPRSPPPRSPRAAGVRSGLEMLLHQAVAQVELMTGKPGPVAAMRTALDAAVALR